MTPAGRLRRRALLRATAAAGATALAGCSRAEPSVQVAVVWSGSELARFREVVAGYGAGVQVISAGNDIDAFLRARQLAGTSPDVAILPRSGLVAEYARRGWLRELSPAASYALPPGMTDLLSADGRRYGVWVKAAHKSLFWYFPSMLPEPPRTWDHLVALTRRLGARARSGDGPAPLAVGAADGWVLTDWFENVLADVAPPGFYEALAHGEADWRAGPVRAALDRLAELWSVDGAFPGGGRRALLTQYEESVIQLVHHRRATMLFEADFVDDIGGIFRRGPEPPETFRFPGARVAGGPLIVGGDAAVAFAGSGRGPELVRWLSDGSAFAPWLRAGGYLSPNVSVPLADYRDPVRRRLAAELRTAQTVRFDLSDRLPGPFTGSDGVGIWRIMQDFFADVTDGVSAREAARRAIGQLAAAAPLGGGRPVSRVLGELAVLDDVGPPRRGRAYPAAGATSALLLPALLLLGGLVAWPVLRTLHASVTTDGRWVGAEHYRTALAAPGTGAVVGRTLLWALVVPAVVTVLGYLLAAASRRSQEGGLVRLILVVPTALPLVVTGVTFRLMYDPDPGRGLATLVAARLTGRSAADAPHLLGPGLVTVALMSAFVWAWVGLAVLVFRAALDAVPPSLADAVRAYGGNRRDVLWDAQWRPLLLRTVAVVFTLVALGTARTFDLILVLAPGSVRDEASVLALRVWQTSNGATTGEGAALGVVWLVAVAAGMLVAALFVRQAWPPPRDPAPVGPDPATPAPRRSTRLLAAGAAVAWLVPLGVLLATSLHGKVDAAARGWWASPPSLASYQKLVTGVELWRTLGFTLVLAAVVTAAVLAVALLAAYPLAWLTGPAAQGTGLLLMAASIVPVQVIAGPVNEVLGVVLSSGTARGLALVHVALGVPFAVLVLRNAFADLPGEQVRAARVGGRHWWGTLRLLARHNRPAVVAVAVLEFVQVWNDLVVGLLFSGPGAVPLGLFLAGQTRGFVANSGELAAGSVIASVLPVLLVVLARRQLVAGLVAGGVR